MQEGLQGLGEKRGEKMLRVFKRRLEKKTDYRKRLALVKSGEIRFVIRRSNKRVLIQAVRFMEVGDKTLLTIDSGKLRKLGWKHSLKNIPAAYLTGYLFGKKVLERGLKKGVLDIGRESPFHKGVVFSALKGIVDAGLEIKHNAEIFPTDERIRGEHIKTFTGTDVVSDFEDVKKKIRSEIK